MQLHRQGVASGSNSRQAKEAASIAAGIRLAGRCGDVDDDPDALRLCYDRANELGATPLGDATSSSTSTATTGTTDGADGTGDTSDASDATVDTAADDSQFTNSTCSAIVAEDTDLTFGDLPGVGPVDADNWEECCALCFDNDECWAW